MKTKTLKNNQNHTVGYIDTDEEGNQTLKNAGHHILGFYEATTNLTRNGQHHLIGHGNLLSTMLYH